MAGEVIHQYINRILFDVRGRPSVVGARRDVDSVANAVEQLDGKLVAAGFALQAFARNAIRSFGEIETAMSKFASRAGWDLGRFRRETEQATHDIARLTGVRHALVAQAVQEGISQGGLQGMQVPEILKMVQEGAKLHAAGQTNILHAVSSAITSRQYGAPSAPWGMRLIYSASQVGAGDPSQYGKEYKDIAPGLNFLNIEQSEGLGALALIAGAAPSLAEGATWIKALLRTISNPQDDARAMLEERTGLTFTEFQNMFSERGGMVRALTLLAENFHGPEIVSFFGRQEAAQGFAALTKVPGQLLRLQEAVRQNAIDDPIARAWTDNVETWRITVERFRRSMDTFLRSFGAPLVAVMKQFMSVMTWVLDALTTFNDAFRGVPAALLGLLGALIGLRAAVNGISATLGLLERAGVLGAGGGGIGSLLFGETEAQKREREEREDARDARDRRNRGWNTAFDAAATGVAAAAGIGETRRQGRRTRFGFAVGGAGSGGHSADSSEYARKYYEWILGGEKGAHPYTKTRDYAREAAEAAAEAARARAETPNWTWWKPKKPWETHGPGGHKNFGPFPYGRSRRERMRDSGIPEWIIDMIFDTPGVPFRLGDFDPMARERHGRFRKWWDHSPSAQGARSRMGAWGDSAAALMMGVGGGMSNLYKAHPKAVIATIATAMGVAVIEGFKWWYKKLDAVGIGDLSSTKVAARGMMLRSNALNTLTGKDTDMRDVEFLGDIDIATLKGRSLSNQVDKASEDLKGMYRDVFSFKEGTGSWFIRMFAADQGNRRMIDAQNDYSESLFALAGKVKHMETLFPDEPQTKAWRAFLDAEIEKGGSWIERLMRYSLQSSNFAPLLPESWTHNPATKGPMEFWHLSATEEFMEKHGAALVSQGIGVLSDEFKRQHAWAKDPQLEAATNYADANRIAREERDAALEAHYRMIRQNPGIKIDIHVGTLNEATLEDLETSVDQSMRNALRSWSDTNDGQLY